MSFSFDVKEELSDIKNFKNKELLEAELLGYFLTGNTSLDDKKVCYITENEYHNSINEIEKGLDFKKGEIPSENAIYSYHTDALITQIIEKVYLKFYLIYKLIMNQIKKENFLKL